MTLQQCRYVLKIAQCGSFNEAARQMFVAQSSLSVSIKALEQELNIKIFQRSGNGVYLTEEGAEFARYARQLVEQNDFILKRYVADADCKRLYISTQHYDFVADVFGKFLTRNQDSNYRFSLREMKTYDVIAETENAYSDIGIIAIKGNDYSVMERYLNKSTLAFTPIFKALPHVYLRKDHPLAGAKRLSSADLHKYPYISYEQGEHSTSFFAEEIGDTLTDKHVEISDRASLMNVLMGTDGYTIGTGVMRSQLNMGRIHYVPYESDDYYVVGYILRTDRNVSPLTQTFIEMLKEEAGAL